MRRTLVFLLLAACLYTPFAPVFVEAKTPTPVVKTEAEKPATKVATKKTIAKKAPVKKPMAKKPVVKKAPAPAVIAAAGEGESEELAQAQIKEVAVSSAPESVTTNPSAACMRAIAAANTFCAKIARGCSSASKTEKCVAANEECEAHQQEALALCPAATQ